MKLGSFETFFSFGLLVIADPASKDDHGDWDPSFEMVHATADSVYVAVRDTGGGIVSVTCIDQDDVAGSGDEWALIFSGALTLLSRRLQFTDPNEMISMIIPVDGTTIRLRIYADDIDEPASLMVVVLPVET